jgi:hypothetical protein
MKPKSKPPTITYNPEWVPEGMPRERWRFIENASRGLRVVGACHEIARSCDRWRSIDHTGWYTDPLGDFGDLATGYVLQLPSRGHEPLYAPAVADPNNSDCYIVDFHDCRTDKMDAALAADHMAERYAEAERDYRTRDAAEQRIEELREEVKAERAKHTAAVRELRALPPGQAQAPTLCALLRDSLADMRSNVRAAIKRIRTLSDDPFAILN